MATKQGGGKHSYTLYIIRMMGIGGGWWMSATPKCSADMFDAKEARVRMSGSTSENVRRYKCECYLIYVDE
ncbi:MAG: hypothetical protein IKQ12_08725 [Prevotella sp.]|nr:hypothetical protein [Prevotella sp.]